jgi:hypothetical protein
MVFMPDCFLFKIAGFTGLKLRFSVKIGTIVCTLYIFLFTIIIQKLDFMLYDIDCPQTLMSKLNCLFILSKTRNTIYHSWCTDCQRLIVLVDRIFIILLYFVWTFKASVGFIRSITQTFSRLPWRDPFDIYLPRKIARYKTFIFSSHVNSKNRTVRKIDAKRIFLSHRKLSASTVLSDVHSIMLVKGNAIIRQTHEIRLQRESRALESSLFFLIRACARSCPIPLSTMWSLTLIA